MVKGIKKDLIGMKFGRLTVVKRVENKGSKPRWLCKCDCGNDRVHFRDSLTRGLVKSCGCLSTENRVTHGLHDHRLYSIYYNMKQRCYNSNHDSYLYYGSRGIIVCDEWLDDFMNFYNWAIDNGYDVNLTLDRKDVNGSYSPDNCKWATQKEQCNNTRRNTYIEINGEIKTSSEWAEIYNMSPSVVNSRYKNGWGNGDLFKSIAEKASKQSGVKNVIWDKHSERWNVRITVEGKQRTVYTSKNIDNAIAARNRYIEENGLKRLNNKNKFDKIPISTVLQSLNT